MLSELMEKTGVKKACIVDDANDFIPQEQDLKSLSDEWNNFLDDIHLNDDLINALSSSIPCFDVGNFSIQDIDQSFIETLWKLKERFPTEISPVFESYNHTKTADKNYVNILKQTLEGNSFEVTTVGRDFLSAARDSHIIFIDLFLYIEQTKDNLDYTIKILKGLISERPNNPPIIVLISRSYRLPEYSERFRDECGIMESGFRFYKKIDLENTGKLLFCIKQLLDYYDDSNKILRFLNSWELHATKAVNDTVASLKKLDLLDHNMIHCLLLKEEGQSSASYFMDLFDTVLLHSFESQSDIIDSAKELNSINFDRVPIIQGLQKEPLQDLMFKSTFMGEQRCKIIDNDAIELGDIFKLIGNKSSKNDILEFYTDDDSVWLVITPSCDLVRNGVSNIGLLKGTLTKVSHDNWSTNTKINTPIIKLNGIPYSIKWDIKSFITYPKSFLQELLSKEVYCRIAKMREINALGLQQCFTADYSRIGQRAVLPSVFKSSIYLYYLNSEGEIVKFSIQDDSNGLFYVGSSNNKIVNFSQIDFENILSSLDGFNIEQSHSMSRKNIERIKNNPYILIEALEGGIEIGKSLKDIKDTTGEVIAKIIFGEPPQDTLKKLKAIGLIFIVNEFS